MFAFLQIYLEEFGVDVAALNISLTAFVIFTQFMLRMAC